MISFNLRCKNDHHFEAWFPDSSAYEDQARRRQVECPTCGDRKIEKALMAPNIASSRTRKDTAADGPSPTQMREALVELRKQVEDNADNVGENFAEEARKIHYGEVEPRGIYGKATEDEAQELNDEGVPFNRVPWIENTDS